MVIGSFTLDYTTVAIANYVHANICQQQWNSSTANSH